MISVPDILDVEMSEDGLRVAIVREAPDWENNRYGNRIAILHESSETVLTGRTDSAAWHPRWRPGGGLAYLEYRKDQGIQIYFSAAAGQTPIPLTAVGGIRSFAWSPDGRSMVVLIDDERNSAIENRKGRFGRFRVEGADIRYRHLWLLEVEQLIRQEQSGTLSTRARHRFMRRLTGGKDFTVGSFFNAGGYAFTPDGKEIVFDHSVDNTPVAVDTQDISAVDIATGAIRPIVTRPGIDTEPSISEDGRLVAFATSNGPYAYYGRDHLAVVPLKGGAPHLLTEAFHESADLIGWRNGNVYFLASDGMHEGLFRVDPISLQIAKTQSGSLNVHHASVGPKGIAIAADNANHGVEAYVQSRDGGWTRLTRATEPFFEPHRKPLSRTIRSESPDGIISKGVLYLPADADPRNDPPRPLLTIVHGGPKRTARPQRVHDYVYPVEYWLERGAAVFTPNYRGSAGFGDSYRALNVRNLGNGPMKDILAGIDTLVSEGIADSERLGIVGWSHGGFLTAYITSRSDRFAAASVGAGISDWRTYYIGSDDPRAAPQYLKATPWADPQIYAAASPMTAILTARTPTLIQHGDRDRRVPLSNARELYRGLQDAGAKVELVVYEGMNHYFSKPKERLAATEHNRRWFDYYLFDGPRPDLRLNE